MMRMEGSSKNRRPLKERLELSANEVRYCLLAAASDCIKDYNRLNKALKLMNSSVSEE